MVNKLFMVFMVALLITGCFCGYSKADTEIVLNDTFDVPVGSATRADDWEDWYDTDWWILDTSQNPNYYVTSGGQNNEFRITDSASAVVGSFHSTPLVEVGDYIQLNLYYRWLTYDPGGDGYFAIGLYHDCENIQWNSSVFADGEEGKTINDEGYFFLVEPTGYSAVKRDIRSTPILQSTDYLDYDFSNPGPAYTDPHSLELKITKTSSGYDVIVKVDEVEALSGSDSSPMVSRFNEIALRQGNLQDDLILDDIKVTTNRVPYGKAWIRSNDFTVGGAINPVVDKVGFHEALMDAELNSSLIYSPSPSAADDINEAGVDMVHIFMNPSSLTEMIASVENFELNSVMPADGYMINDEPSRHNADPVKDFDYIAQKINWLKREYPEKLIYSNAMNSNGVPADFWGDSSNPSYTWTDHINDFIKVIRPDVMMWDQYPFDTPTLEDPINELDLRWWSELMGIRAAAQRNRIPYTGWVQGYKDDPNLIKSRYKREPSESDLRMQVFSMLTAGYKGIHYYRFLDQGGLDPGEIKTGIINSYAEDANDVASYSDMYFHIQGFAFQAINIGQHLRFMESTDVRFIPGGTGSEPNNPTPDGLTNWSSGAGDVNFIDSVKVDLADPNNRGDRKDGMIGFFKDDDGHLYFMLTNVYHGRDLLAEDASLTFVMEFDETLYGLVKFNRFDGSQEAVLLTNNLLTTTLPGGTGDLYRLANPSTCSEAIALGFGMSADLSFDCRVDMSDFTIFASQWSDSTMDVADIADFVSQWLDCMVDFGNCY